MWEDEDNNIEENSKKKEFLFTEQQLRKACDGAWQNGQHYGCGNYSPDPFDLEEFIDEIKNPKPIEEDTVPITLGQIKRTCGWSEYCDVTGGNHYMLNEWTVSDREIFDVKVSHAKKLKLI